MLQKAARVPAHNLGIPQESVQRLWKATWPLRKVEWWAAEKVSLEIRGATGPLRTTPPITRLGRAVSPHSQRNADLGH